MTAYFIGGAAGSAAAGAVYAGWGWTGVWSLGIAIGAGLVGAWAWDAARPSPGPDLRRPELSR
jgi:hypothetical protein